MVTCTNTHIYICNPKDLTQQQQVCVATVAVRWGISLKVGWWCCRVTAVSRCYRAETSDIAEEKGIYRVHQFTKVKVHRAVCIMTQVWPTLCSTQVHGLCHFTLWLVPDLNRKFDVIVTPHVSAVMPDHSSVVQMLHGGMWAVPSPTPEQKWAKHSWHQSCALEGRQLHRKNHGNPLDSWGEEDGQRQRGAEL